MDRQLQSARLNGAVFGAMSMDAEAILHELTHAAGLPTAALQAASAQRAELLPKFLGVIEDYLRREPAARANPTPLFFIFHLLGEWREKTGYRPLAQLLRCPADEIDAIFGDGITLTSHRVMAALFDGDPQPLCDIILDPNAEEFVRSRMCEALAMVTLRGELDRDLVGLSARRVQRTAAPSPVLRLVRLAERCCHARDGRVESSGQAGL